MSDGDRVEQAPEFTREDDAILDRIWDELGREEPPPPPPARGTPPGRDDVRDRGPRTPYIPPSRR